MASWLAERILSTRSWTTRGEGNRALSTKIWLQVYSHNFAMKTLLYSTGSCCQTIHYSYPGWFAWELIIAGKRMVALHQYMYIQCTVAKKSLLGFNRIEAHQITLSCRSRVLLARVPLLVVESVRSSSEYLSTTS
jgi:hypothetical protein